MRKKFVNEDNFFLESRARVVALDILSNVIRNKKPLTRLFDSLDDNIEARDRAFIYLLVLTTLRHIGEIDHALGLFLKKKPDGMTQDILRLGVSQIIFIGSSPHAAVDTSVKLAQNLGREGLSGLVNAVLRKVSTNRQKIISRKYSPFINTPDWLQESWETAYGKDEAIKISQSHMFDPLIDITFKYPELNELKENGLESLILPNGSLRIRKPKRVNELPGFKEGNWWVQDAAAVYPAKILLWALGASKANIVDLCAAPGGKTMQLSAAGHSVTSVDISASRMQILKENLFRTNLSADCVVVDFLKWRPERLFDAVLLDCPCSSTGTIRRNPDIALTKCYDDIIRYSQSQKLMIKRALQFLVPGGFIVYACCSIQSEEGPDVIKSILKDNNINILPIDCNALQIESSWIDEIGAIRTLPFYWSDRGGMDGFYIALLQKK